jgi:hypothetical protein
LLTEEKKKTVPYLQFLEALFNMGIASGSIDIYLEERHDYEYVTGCANTFVNTSWKLFPSVGGPVVLDRVLFLPPISNFRTSFYNSLE